MKTHLKVYFKYETDFIRKKLCIGSNFSIIDFFFDQKNNKWKVDNHEWEEIEIE